MQDNGDSNEGPILFNSLASQPIIDRVKRVGHRASIAANYHQRSVSDSSNTAYNHSPNHSNQLDFQLEQRRFGSLAANLELSHQRPTSSMSNPQINFDFNSLQIPQILGGRDDFRAAQDFNHNQSQYYVHQPISEQQLQGQNGQYKNDHQLIYNMQDESVYQKNSKLSASLDQIVTICTWGICNLEFQDQDLLVTHIMQDHVGNGKASYVCEWRGCGRLMKPFSKRHKIQNHVRIHTGERPFPCPVAECGKRFSRQDGLNTHIKTHSSVKPYLCSFPPCTKAYFHSRSLRKHERGHQEYQEDDAFVQNGTFDKSVSVKPDHDNAIQFENKFISSNQVDFNQYDQKPVQFNQSSVIYEQPIQYDPSTYNQRHFNQQPNQFIQSPTIYDSHPSNSVQYQTQMHFEPSQAVPAYHRDIRYEYPQNYEGQEQQAGYLMELASLTHNQNGVEIHDGSGQRQIEFPWSN